MDLNVTVSASESYGRLNMAKVYCLDDTKNYCVSLVRVPGQSKIEVMVSDQLVKKVDSLGVVLSDEGMKVTISESDSVNLDGISTYNLYFKEEVKVEELELVLKTIFKDKSGLVRTAS